MSLKPKNERPKRKRSALASELTAASGAAPTESETPTSVEASEAGSIERRRRVDGWFDHQLISLYREVMDEPIPGEMLALIGKLKDPN